MKVLITSIGITGKSSLLKWLQAYLPLIQKTVFLDLDYEREKLPKEFDPDTIYFLEDVHGPTKNAVIPLKEYDLVLYLLPSWFTHLKFWLSRMSIWYQNGNYAWDADKGSGKWAGTGVPQDLRNVPGILKYFWSHFLKRGSTIKEDLSVLKKSGIKTILVIPEGRGEKIAFCFKKF